MLMEKKTGTRAGLERKILWMVKALLCAYVVTGIMLLILTVLLYKLGLSEENVNAGIILIYVISLISLGIYHSLQGEAVHLVTTFLLCAGGGMLGGMVS